MGTIDADANNARHIDHAGGLLRDRFLLELKTANRHNTQLFGEVTIKLIVRGSLIIGTKEEISLTHK